ncbi:MAG: PilZ domain-containing protein [Candidatus Omnitrophota bacterium]
MAYEDKRRFPRITLKTSLGYQVRGKPNIINAVCDNLSCGGASFTNNDFIAPNTILALEINVPQRVIRPFGRIAWVNSLPHSNRYRMGIEFVEWDTLEKDFLSEFINMHTNKL